MSQKTHTNKRLNNAFRSFERQPHWILSYTPFIAFCHIRIDNPLQASTFTLSFSNFSAGRTNTKMCRATTESKVIITDSGTNIWPIEEVLCTAVVKNGNVTFVYNNPSIDIYAQNTPYTFIYNQDTSVKFNLSVDFHACGGLITEQTQEAQAGTITSPNWSRGNYTNSAECLWTLQAPEGKIVTLNFTFMDIEHSINGCNSDFLEVSEGQDRHSVFHRYCNDNGDHKMEDRYRTIRTVGRHLTLYFHSDSSVSGRGFSADWEFVGEVENQCGFTTHAKTGLIHSPGYPNGKQHQWITSVCLDYANNADCKWWIVVPVGFHIRVEFEQMDIQESLELWRRLYFDITRTSFTRIRSPFYLLLLLWPRRAIEQDMWITHSTHSTLFIGGAVIPKPIDSESNQIRVNFTSNAKITGRGFTLKWEARCGTVFLTSHGVVASPYYPHYYPNENFECRYLINPDTEGPQIVTLRITDFDLDSTIGRDSLTDSPLNVATSDRACNSDYLQIIDVNRDVPLQTICGDQTSEDESGLVFSIKGPVGIHFVSNVSMLHDYINKKKNHRGFKITYALSDCGGKINLPAFDHNRMAATIKSPGFPLPYHDDLEVCLEHHYNGRLCNRHQVHVHGHWSKWQLHVWLCGSVWRLGNGQWHELWTFVWTGIASRKSADNQQQSSDPFCHRFLFIVDWIRGCFGKVLISISSNFKWARAYAYYYNSRLRLWVRLPLNCKSPLFVGPNRGCGGNLAARNYAQRLVSPYDNATNMYHNNLRCLWKIRANADQVIEIKLKQFDLEKTTRNNNVSSCYDFLAVSSIHTNTGTKCQETVLTFFNCETTHLPLRF